MSHEQRDPVPAALPAVVFILLLELAPRLVWPAATCAGMLAVAVLATFTAFPLRNRLIILALAAASGTAIAIHHRAAGKEISFAVDALPAARFVTVTAHLRDDWRTVGEACELEVDSFQMLEPRPLAVAAPLRIRLQSAPAARSDGRESIVARGFLRSGDDGRLSLLVKSPLLIEYRGVAGAWNPRNWNRAMAARLRALAQRDPSLQRPVQLAEAVALGRTGELPEDAREPYRRGGTYHLLVFSGMQIALAAALAAAATAHLGRPRITDLTLVALSILAVPFAGWEPSVVRAASMIGLYAISRILRRPTSITNLLFVFAVVRLASCPEELHQASFQLTCAAVLGVLTVGRATAGRLHRWLRPLGYGWGATLATTPLTLFWFRQWTPAGALSTALLSPLAAAMYFASAGASVVPAKPLMIGCLRMVGLLDRICGAANGFLGGAMELRRFAPAPPAALVLGALLLFAASLDLDQRWMRRAGTAMLVIPLFCSLLALRARREVMTPEIDVLDVGQGDAILLRSGRRTLLLDGGGHGIDSRFGRSTLIPMLVERGVTAIDVVALSHPHPDHCGGLIAVLSDLPVGELWISPAHVRDPCTARLIEEAGRKGTALIPLATGRSRALGDLSLTPFVPAIRFKRSAMNNSSVVFFSRVGSWRVLLTGDAEEEAEDWLLESGANLHAEILKVGHHGSRTSTTAAFLNAVGPRVAAISCGRHNSFGHPGVEVVRALKRAGVRLYRTDQQGSITVVCGQRLLVRHEIDTPR